MIEMDVKVWHYAEATGLGPLSAAAIAEAITALRLHGVPDGALILSNESAGAKRWIVEARW